MIISLAGTNGWPIMHADIPQAFLRSLLPEDVFVGLPKGVMLKDRKTHLFHNTDNMVLKA